MTKVITLYNNIGGVYKTTTLFNIAAFLSKKGKRVLLVDCDPRCSLSGLFFGSYPELINPIKELPGTSIYEVLKPRFDGSQKSVDISKIELERSQKYTNLFILRGDLDFYIAESFFARAWINAISADAYAKNNYMVLNILLKKLAKYYTFDYIFCDVGACPSYTSRLILLYCDNYFVPLIPDRFNFDSVQLLENTICRWIKRHKQVLGTIEDLELCDLPKATYFSGGIIHYSKAKITEVERQWTSKIEEKMKELMRSISISPNINKVDPFIAHMSSLSHLASIAQQQGIAIFDIDEKVFYQAEEGRSTSKAYVSYGWDYWRARVIDYENFVNLMAVVIL